MTGAPAGGPAMVVGNVDGAGGAPGAAPVAQVPFGQSVGSAPGAGGAGGGQILVGALVPPVLLVLYVVGIIAWFAAFSTATPMFEESLGVSDGNTTHYSGEIDASTADGWSVSVEIGGGQYASTDARRGSEWDLVVWNRVATLGEGDGSRTAWNATLDDAPVSPHSVTVRWWYAAATTGSGGGRGELAVDPGVWVSDDGNGGFPPGAAVSGSINYSSGALEITFDEAPDTEVWVMVEWRPSSWGQFAPRSVGTYHDNGTVELDLLDAPPAGAEVRVTWYDDSTSTADTVGFALAFVLNPLVLVLGAGVGGVMMGKMAFVKSMAASAGITLLIAFGGCFALIFAFAG